MALKKFNELKKISLKFCDSCEIITLSISDFNKTYSNTHGIVNYNNEYSDFEGETLEEWLYSNGIDYESDCDNELMVFEEGDKIALIENTDWHENLSEIVGEITFTKRTNGYIDYSPSFVMGNRVITFPGEYSPLEDKYTDYINKEFGTNYKIIITN
jgi:hypothetical protein